MWAVTALLLAIFLASSEALPQQSNKLNLRVFVGAGYELSAYDPVINSLKEHSNINASLCIAHSIDGASNLAADAVSSGCSHAMFLASAPSPELLMGLRVPSLVFHGLLDGVVRFSQYAVHRHRALRTTGMRTRFAALRGAAHHSFASGKPSPLVEELDLIPEASHDEVYSNLAAVARDFLLGGGPALAEAEATAAASQSMALR